MSNEFEPTILGFLCNWCSYAGADMAGVSRLQYPPNLRTIRVMCSGRVDPAMIFSALLKGADAVLVGGCHLGDCHYIEGNYHAENKILLTEKILEKIGLHPKRLWLRWVSAAEGTRFAAVMQEITTEVKQLGPLGEAEKTDPAVLKRRLKAAEATVNSERFRWLIGRQRGLLTGKDVYGRQMEPAEYHQALIAMVDDELKKSEVKLTMEKQPRSVKDVAAELGYPARDVVKVVVDLRKDKAIEWVDVVDHAPRYQTVPSV